MKFHMNKIWKANSIKRKMVNHTLLKDSFSILIVYLVLRAMKKIHNVLSVLLAMDTDMSNPMYFAKTLFGPIINSTHSGDVPKPNIRGLGPKTGSWGGDF